MGPSRLQAMPPAPPEGREEGVQYPALVPKMGAVGGGARSSGNSRLFGAGDRSPFRRSCVLHFCLRSGQAGGNRGFSRKSAVLLQDSSSPSGTQGSVLTDLVFPTAFAHSVGVPPLVLAASALAKWLPWSDLGGGVSSGPGQLCFLSVRLFFVTGSTWHTGPGALCTPHSSPT